MNITKILVGLLFVACLGLVSKTGFSQITSTADKIVKTEYTTGTQDDIHVFCGEKGSKNASLTAHALPGETATFEWSKYNAQSGSFTSFISESGTSTSTVSSLEDGCYRVKVTSTSGEKIYTAWVFNNYIEPKAEITDSDCHSFTLKGTPNPLSLNYIDLKTGQSLTLGNGIGVKWTTGDEVVSQVATSVISDPPTKNTTYTFEVTDKFGCEATAEVVYNSIVTKAAFTYTLEDQTKSHPTKKEAPLTVTFNNASENGDPGKFEWFIFKSKEDLVKEAEENQGKVKDSIMVRLYNDSPIYIFENPGSYRVKLVSKKNTCSDTVYIDKYIVIDESFVEAPNVFTPNGDGDNDKFIVRFFSMKSVKISIFNRWGKIMHEWGSNNVSGFGSTIESTPQAVWDGKVGGKLATPGVYYYVVEGIGRDGERRSSTGFFHLFRDK